MTMPLHPPKAPMSELQRVVLDFVKGEIAAGRPFPSLAGIADHMGWSVAGARDCIGRLVWRGLVRQTTIYIEQPAVRGFVRRIGEKHFELTSKAEP